MNILLLSDLHHENFAPPHTRLFDGKLRHDQADVVVLAGDIDVGRRGLEWAAQEFGRHSAKPKPIVYVPGNHEHYGREISANLEDMRQAAADLGVFLLERTSVAIDDTLFLGTTLWTDFEIFGWDERAAAIREAEMSIRDFERIWHRDDTGARVRIRAEQTMEWHHESSEWLQRELRHAIPSKTVVVTHHAPHIKSIHEKYRNELTTAAFVSGMEHLFGMAHLWLHGHVHNRVEYGFAGTKVYANPRGNMTKDGTFENQWFDASWIVG